MCSLPSIASLAAPWSITMSHCNVISAIQIGAPLGSTFSLLTLQEWTILKISALRVRQTSLSEDRIMKWVCFTFTKNNQEVYNY